MNSKNMCFLLCNNYCYDSLCKRPKNRFIYKKKRKKMAVQSQLVVNIHQYSYYVVSSLGGVIVELYTRINHFVVVRYYFLFFYHYRV